jgi:hypothetical protein
MKKLGIILAIVVVAGTCVFAALVLITDITPMGDIDDNPAKYHSKEVMILGEVNDRIAYQEHIVFKMRDETGVLPVHSTSVVPAIGDEVVVNGIVTSLFKIGPFEYGTMLEASEIRSPYIWEKLAKNSLTISYL